MLPSLAADPQHSERQTRVDCLAPFGTPSWGVGSPRPSRPAEPPGLRDRWMAPGSLAASTLGPLPGSVVPSPVPLRRDRPVGPLTPEDAAREANRLRRVYEPDTGRWRLTPAAVRVWGGFWLQQLDLGVGLPVLWEKNPQDCHPFPGGTECESRVQLFFKRFLRILN